MINISQLSYAYPNQQGMALREVSLEIGAGEFVLLTGASGSGKSTLLRVLSGLAPHFSGGVISGEIRVAGRDPLHEGPQRLSQTVGFVFQSPEAQSVVDHVEAEIAFALENAAFSVTEMRVRVEEVLQLLELSHLRQRSLSTLSGGERQRVAIAAALALRPTVLALDEPTSQLDPQSASEVLNALVRLNDDLGLTIILAEHRLERVLRYAERVVTLDAGRIVVNGLSPAVLAQMPQAPPLTALGRRLSWSPLPVTVKEGLAFARHVALPPPGQRVAGGASRSREILRVRNVHFAYGSRQVLNGASLAVLEGEAVVLMGRNGSGKTTLLRTIVGLLNAPKGDVEVAGKATRDRDVADICRDVAYLPQVPDDLLFAESVFDELATTLHNHRLAPDGAAIHRMLTQLNLQAHAEAYPRDLSVGQRQRVALGAVAITMPPLLLLDEPTRGLDYSAKAELVALWRRLRENGMGMLMVTHDVELAAQVADRVLIMSEGQIIADGSAAEVLGSSPLFAPQIARLFPRQGWLTAEEAYKGITGDSW